ncbi:hypothetical protein H9X95_03765 [Micromonospora chalcea]|uniref:hypothetical protein n=1 Tax=Micromonospora chalcea TaxID=1874 RepID=UPI001656914B|nr:hypothetical protein [Micromonospora chalcea]MBC8989277.1 hypothetical protein [Micromonospora chalcea]
MLVHRPGRYAAVIPGALARIHSDFARSGLTLGVSAGLPKKGVSDTANYLDQCGTAAIKIADPEGFALPTDLVADPTLTEAQRTKVSYVQSAPQAGTPADRSWNKQVAREQRAAGANVLLTPGRSLDPNNATWELAEANRALDDLIDEVDGDEVPAWNLTLPATWLIDENLRGQLLAELVDRDDALVWYIRVRWPLIRRSFGQTLNSQLLTGYRELAETARLEDRALLLPATGLTGWLALSWGALGFGTGPSSASQAWADHPRIAARPGVTRTTVNRFFSSPLLHTISVDSHNSLARTLSANDYPPCDCSYCETQAEALTWQPQTAAGHAVYAMGRLASAVASRRRSERASEIARLVRRSNDLYNSLPLGSQLDPKEEPEHLSVWQAEVTGSPR